MLAAGGAFHTTKGSVSHDELIDGPEGVVVNSVGGTAFLALRPLLNEFTVTMPRGAAVIYPKDAAQLMVSADIFPGARVLEAGVGSGSLTCYLLRAVGEDGRVTSYERREDFAAIARQNVDNFFGAPHPAWELRVDDLVTGLALFGGFRGRPPRMNTRRSTGRSSTCSPPGNASTPWPTC